MTNEELVFIRGPEGQALIEENISETPTAIALRYGGKGIPAAALASQVKYLQRARRKLPSWFEARCILPGRAFEQCSSETAARLKPFVTGVRALDLTCGLGIDSFFLAQKFAQVTAVEQDATLVDVVRHNYAQMNISNVEVLPQSAEAFLESYAGPPFDLVYLDPDRRDSAGARKFLLADCQPDVLDLRDQLCAIGRRVMIKVSPMLDISALLMQLAPVDRITVLAVENECKELLIELGASDGLRLGVVFSQGGQMHRFETAPYQVQLPETIPEENDYVYEADISLYKAGLVTAWWQENYPDLPGGMNHSAGYYFSPVFIDKFPGRVFSIQKMMYYKPAQIRSYLSQSGLRRVNLSRRHFDLPIRKLKEQLHILEGGEDFLLFTRMPDGERVMLHAQRVF